MSYRTEDYNTHERLAEKEGGAFILRLAASSIPGTEMLAKFLILLEATLPTVAALHLAESSTD
ncbi:hypothetical protein [Bartonella sp. WD16.2]|uniref:hypothetical protein n=1 Tax=Bartonella sp. WD16.2 TaxID=1933904 RepID=UPI00129473F9|nr:hypothetical protein [Bartonella sp. WD16.2]